MTSDAIEEVTDFIAFLRESIEHEEQSHARYMNAARFLQSDDDHAGGADHVEVVGRVEGIGGLARQHDLAFESDLAGNELQF